MLLDFVQREQKARTARTDSRTFHFPFERTLRLFPIGTLIEKRHDDRARKGQVRDYYGNAEYGLRRTNGKNSCTEKWGSS